MKPVTCFTSLGVIVELTWAVSGLSGAPVGQSWRPLGALLGRFEPSWAVLGLSWAILGASWAVLGPSWAVLGLSRGPLGPFLSRLEKGNMGVVNLGLT